jgi:hypothetical protein
MRRGGGQLPPLSFLIISNCLSIIRLPIGALAEQRGSERSASAGAPCELSFVVATRAISLASLMA